MASPKTNKIIFPQDIYTGANISYFKIPNDSLGSIQIDHPATGTLEVAASIDYQNQNYDEKSWTVLPVKLLGGSVFLPIITFTDTEPTIIKFSCASFAFLRLTLTGAGGTYRAIYNSPLKNGGC